MATTVITFEFGIIHYSSLEKNSEACLSAVLWTDTKINWTWCKLWHFGLELPGCYTWVQISLIPTLCMLNKIDDFLQFLEGIFEFFLISNQFLPDRA